MDLVDDEEGDAGNSYYFIKKSEDVEHGQRQKISKKTFSFMSSTADPRNAAFDIIRNMLRNSNESKDNGFSKTVKQADRAQHRITLDMDDN